MRFTHNLTVSFVLAMAFVAHTEDAPISVEIEQITFGPHHHFFGYIGQSKTIPWNASGRYILSLQSAFHDRLPHPGEPARIVLIDTHNDNTVVPVDESRAWNIQQGTMFYWNPKAPETQFFFNDRDPGTQHVFTVLYDIEERKRVREFRYDDTPFGNSGVSPNGEYFLGISYGRMDLLRKVTGYPGAFDWSRGVAAPDNDGIFIVDVAAGRKRLLISFKAMADRLRPMRPDVDEASLYINHTLWNRDSDIIYFYMRGRRERQSMWVNQPCTIRPDGTEFTIHETFIGGHPEWGEGAEIYGSDDDRQVVYDVEQKKIIRQLGDESIFPNPTGDISLSPDGKWFVNGYPTEDRENFYSIMRLSDGEFVRTRGFSRGPYKRGAFRIDPAPRWNRTSDAILVPHWTEEDTRQLFVIRVNEGLPQ